MKKAASIGVDTHVGRISLKIKVVAWRLIFVRYSVVGSRIA